MPIRAQRDVEQSRKSLAAWFAGVLSADGDVELSEFRGPGATGFSNETIILDASWSADGADCSHTFVVRVAPTGYALFPDAAFDVQHKVLIVLGADGTIPVPTVRWYETDPSVMGAPFFVMDEVVGKVPPDNPLYHISGWLHDVEPAVRERIWWGAIDTMADLHRLNWRSLGLGFLDVPDAGLAQLLACYEAILAQIEQTEQVPVARRALEWLQANKPTSQEPLVLCWSDARVGNVMYDDAGRRLAVLD